ncbi:T9SS type A sorting domain-containing protein [Hymenobacter baengnokdamensis]|uniref:T9SS type A sorting domain-containing protein n=1 Tax=Hymenobacter baengnokdamensis TaxID=2615203 RepID=UPI001244ED5F|nr:T9SS type A sorting domain-containing protein [Hymenobacter baengnokdamensis]
MKTFTTLLLTAGLFTLGSRAASAQTLLDNFEDVRLVNYPAVQGTLTAVANPGSMAPNTSSTVGSFVRDGSQQYATITIVPKTGKFADVSPYVSGTKKLSMKFRSPGPGVKVQLVLQNKAKATAAPYVYPQGNFSGTFNATTAAAANTWETLTFAYSAAQSDGSVTAADIDQLAMLIDLGTNNANTYYIDDIMGPEFFTSTTTPPVVTDQLYDNYEGTRAVTYKGSRITSGGFKLDTLNPASSTANSSAHVMRYTRSNQQYDVLFLAPKGAPLADVTPFLSNAKQMTMKVYGAAAGTVFQITLQDSAKSRAAYPAGRHSEYTATAKGGGWETLVFSNSNRPDTSVPPTGLNEIVLLIAPNTLKPGKFYIDDWTGPHLTNYVVTATRASQTSAAALAPAYPNPAAGLTHLGYSLQKSAVVSLAVYDAMGRRVASVVENQTRPAGDYTADLRTTSLAPGFYTCRLVVDGVALTQSLSVE